ncbi:uncharacterized protein isoform X1 [Musca autumnalis]|uniref:uncharacterized protein isoform X1 n=1 Tax=Musca autumnalis TaxID=221902 RepID=UPI003CEEA7A8
MTDLRRSVDTTTRFHQKQQQHQQQSVTHDSYRSSCNSSPEPKSSLALCQSLSNGSYRHPLLQNLTDHPHMNSTSGGSSSTSTTATATTIGRSSQYISENGNHNSSMGEIQFDEREIYYVSPSKRKSSLSGGSQTPVLRSSLRACERLRSFSPTSAAAIAPSYPPIMPSAAYGARLSGTVGQDLSFDNYEASSHYSDTAMQVLRSGSCSAMTSILNTNNLINQSTTSGGAASSSNDSSSNQQQRSTHQNNVTFSNHISEQRVITSQNRGSLRRSKGRSNQSLCSCDAGSDAELNPDPARPLYEYSLERRRKVHTYTCEQNAQILLRLERERNRKLSLSGGSSSAAAIAIGSSSKDDLESDALSSSDAETIPPVPPPPAMKRNGSIRSLRLLQHLQQQQQQHQHQINPRSSSIHCNGKQTATTTAQDNSHQHTNNNNAHNNNNSNNNNNHSSGSIATLCSGDLLNDCTKSVHDVRAVIDDCTTSILKCANAVSSDIMSTTSTTTNGSYKPQYAATLATTAHSKPDVCHVTKSSDTAAPFGHYPPPYPIHDDITVPRSQKSDPSLCFLHKSSSGAINVGPPPLPPMMGAYHTTDFHLSQRDLQQKLQQYKNSSRLSLSKYNTIGPSSDYARQLAMYSSQLQQHQSQYPLQQQPQTQYATMRPLGAGERCRCFSKSWSNFSRDFMQSSLCANHDNHIMPQQRQQIFHTSSTAAAGKGRTEPSSNLLRSSSSYNSRSFNNLVDIMDNYNYDTMTSSSLHHHHQKLHVTNSQTCNGTTKAATLISNSNNNSSSGLKDNKLLHGHQHLHQHYPPLSTQHKDFHCDDHHLVDGHHHHHHALVGSGSGHLLKSASASASSSEKFHQSNGSNHHHHPAHHSSLTSIMPWKHRQSPSRGSSSSGTNSFRFDAAKHWLAVSSILLIIGAASVAVPLALRVAASAPFEERLRVALQLLDQVPLIDGHNDLPWNIRKFLHNKLNDFNFNEDLREVAPWKVSQWSHTDLTRLKKGKVSAQFWAAYVPCEAQHRDAVQLTLEQIDVIKRLTDRYSPQLTTCTSAQEIIEAHKNHQLCSLTGVEGGHSLGGSLAVLRTLYAIGVRYMTLTSTCHTPWADSSYADAPTFNVKHGGLTIFGKTIIREMNRLGMMVDLSHVSTGTMRDALEVTEAPVIFSHSSAYELCNSSRNVQDDMLQSMAKNGGIIMVNFYSRFLSCSENATVHDAVAHINHIKRVAGIDHVGLGAGYDGINFTPKGLEDVSSYPTLFAELLGAGWSIEDLTKLAGGNFLRVMQQVERVRDEKRAAGVKPYEDHPNFRAEDPYNCTSS